MRILTLFRYEKEGNIIVSAVNPDCEYTEKYRLIADDGYELTNGEITAKCIDTYDISEWTEVFNPSEEHKAQAYDILTGVAE